MDRKPDTMHSARARLLLGLRYMLWRHEALCHGPSWEAAEAAPDAGAAQAASGAASAPIAEAADVKDNDAHAAEVTAAREESAAEAAEQAEAGPMTPRDAGTSEGTSKAAGDSAGAGSGPPGPAERLRARLQAHAFDLLRSIRAAQQQLQEPDNSFLQKATLLHWVRPAVLLGCRDSSKWPPCCYSPAPLQCSICCTRHFQHVCKYDIMLQQECVCTCIHTHILANVRRALRSVDDLAMRHRCVPCFSHPVCCLQARHKDTGGLLAADIDMPEWSRYRFHARQPDAPGRSNMSTNTPVTFDASVPQPQVPSQKVPTKKMYRPYSSATYTDNDQVLREAEVKLPPFELSTGRPALARRTQWWQQGEWRRRPSRLALQSPQISAAQCCRTQGRPHLSGCSCLCRQALLPTAALQSRLLQLVGTAAVQRSAVCARRQVWAANCLLTLCMLMLCMVARCFA